MFNEVFAEEKLPKTYIRLAANSASEAVKLMRAINIAVMNVTAPFKEDIIEHLDAISDIANAIGSVNTIVNTNGRLTGYNTDYVGVCESIAHAGERLEKRSCIVIGAGGAGKAAAYGLCARGAQVTIINRTVEKAREAALKFGCEYAGFDSLQALMQRAEIIVFSLSQNINPVDPAWFLPHHVVFDANYKSSEFSAAARSCGCKIIEGLDWLLFQAVEAHNIFFNTPPDLAHMRKGLLSYRLQDKKDKIALVGFMGTGKTTTGKKLAKKMNCSFVDTDDLIVEHESMSIPEIFATKGEDYFRQVERAVLKKVINVPGKCIISCGGGLVLNDENRAILQEHCLVLWFFASPQSIIKRIKPGSRPLLNVANPLEKATAILEERKYTYASAADVLINTEVLHPDEITDKIYEEISKTFTH
jgi:shikimate dehydrogenase